ncbi:MAG: hypothetical protein ACPGUE_08960 [Marinomonas sp.]
MYQDTAYNTENLIEQSEGEALGYWTKKLNSANKFRHRKADETVSISAIKDYLPSDEIIMTREAIDKDGNKTTKELFWNEKDLLKESFNPITQFYLIIVALAKVFFYSSFPFLTLTLLYLLLSSPDEENSKIFFELLPGFQYFVLPCGLIYGHALLMDKKGFHWLIPPFIKVGNLFSLNRQTGMVTLYKRGNKVRFSHPFSEFDCYFISSPTPQGHKNTALALAHRYNNYKQGVPLHLLLGTDESVLECQNLWNMIQRYMDVSQPLPDCIILEESRERDPVTAAYDKETGRNPRYWRDMTDEEYLAALKKLNKAQQENTESAPLIDIIKGEVLDTPMVVQHKPQKHPKNRYKHKK